MEIAFRSITCLSRARMSVFGSEGMAVFFCNIARDPAMGQGGVSGCRKSTACTFIVVKLGDDHRRGNELCCRRHIFAGLSEGRRKSLDLAMVFGWLSRLVGALHRGSAAKSSAGGHPPFS